MYTQVRHNLKQGPSGPVDFGDLPRSSLYRKLRLMFLLVTSPTLGITWANGNPDTLFDDDRWNFHVLQRPSSQDRQRPYSFLLPASTAPYGALNVLLRSAS